MSLAAALLAFQAEAPTLSKNAAGQVGSRHYKYVDLHSIVEQITPLLAKHGLTWTTRPTGTHDAPTLTYELLWEGANEKGAYTDKIKGEMPLYLPDAPTSQALGSAITYARRYALTAVLNLVADEDDDGQAAGSESRKQYASRMKSAQEAIADPGEKPSDKQKGRIRAELTRLGARNPKDEAKLYAYLFSKPLSQGADIADSVTRMQASAVLDQLIQKGLPTGESDVPSDDAPQHEPVQDETLPFS